MIVDDQELHDESIRRVTGTGQSTIGRRTLVLRHWPNLLARYAPVYSAASARWAQNMVFPQAALEPIANVAGEGLFAYAPRQDSSRTHYFAKKIPGGGNICYDDGSVKPTKWNLADFSRSSLEDWSIGECEERTCPGADQLGALVLER
ncbi:MAG TPA: hypothetical protein VHV26_17075 [Rhizomicrobium sp.]|jgi:hypothetical protein|nr:hypothetical protein [Rhizomicrobium sp.]